MMNIIGELTSADCIKRHYGNPIVTCNDVPVECDFAYNAGVVKFNGKYVMLIRCDSLNEQGDRVITDYMKLVLGFSDDGYRWQFQDKPSICLNDEEITCISDPRLTVIDGRAYVTCWFWSKHGILGGIFVTDDFESFELLHITTPDNRNMVLYPEKINGMYVRLERPFPVYSRKADRFDIWSSMSPDLRYWGDSKLVLGVEDIPYSNDKIGPGASPVKTEKGWLHIIHAVDLDISRGKNGIESMWHKRYTMGAMLTDIEDPTRVIGLYQQPLMAPETSYETENGLRNDVLFPGGVILEDDGELRIYYGAADAVECLATADVGEIIKLCTEYSRPSLPKSEWFSRRKWN